MTENKALATAALVLAGAIVRDSIQKRGIVDPESCWLAHLEAIAELLRPSPEIRAAVIQVCIWDIDQHLKKFLI